MLNRLLELLYPPKCLICGNLYNINTKDTYYACKKCKIKLKYGMTDLKIIKIYDKNFDYLISPFIYKGEIRKLILDYKFNNKKYLYLLFSNILADVLYEYIKEITIDYIVPVPISFNRYKERGYNQSYLISKRISQTLHIKLLRFSLIKTKNNKRQSELCEKDRVDNVKNVYKVFRKNLLKNKVVLLIDDIYTTGNTLNECSKILKKANVSTIIALTIAKA